MSRAARLLIAVCFSVLHASALVAQEEPVAPSEPDGPSEPSEPTGPDIVGPEPELPGGGFPTPPGCDGPCGPAPGTHDDRDEGEDPFRPEPESRSMTPRVVRIGVFGPPELVITGPVSQFDAANAALQDAGATLRRYRDLSRLGIRLAAFELRGGEAAAARARAILDQAAPDTTVGVHHIYDLAQGGPRTYAAQMIGDTEPGACPLGQRRAIGLIDGPVDADHPALAGVEVVSRSFLTESDREPPMTHGTAVAALLAGDDPGGAFGGFAPGADLYAASAFSEIRQQPGADIERIATAIEWLLRQDVRLINMSFAGPENPVLDDVLDRAAGRGVVMIAAAGNEGRERAAYPAAHPGVIAVTAIDAAYRRYRAANFGDHIEFAAPGVDLFVASEQGGSYASGTSYAAPIVTALAARLGAGGGLTADALRARLRGSAVDLGPDGFDAEFGWGLVRGGC